MDTKKDLRILYVDDEQINVDLFKMTFQKFFDIRVAQSGNEGLEIITQNMDFDVVISDMKMPKMDGIDFITKSKEYLPNAHFFILTGFDINPEIEESLKNGLIDGYFNKPINRQDLREKLKEI